MILVTAFCLTSAASAGILNMGFAMQLKEKDFDTPEKAVTHFVDAIVQGDLETALQACGANDCAAGFDAKYYYTRMHIVPPTGGAPSQYPFYAQLNQAMFLSTVTTQLKFFILGFADSDAARSLGEGQNYTLSEDAESKVQAFVQSIDPSILKNLKIVRMDLPNKDMMEKESNKQTIEAQYTTYGADEYTERIVMYDLNGTYYYGGFTLLRFGECWRIVSVSSLMGSVPSYGTAQKITMADYEALL
jgi:hypothetical protein